MKRRTRLLTALGAAITITAAVLVSGPGYDTSQVRIRPATAWLASTATGAAVLVDGITAELSATVKVAEPGAALSVTQHRGAALVLNHDTGELSRVDSATLNVTKSAAPLPPGPGLVLKPAADQVYRVDVHSGMVASAKPDTLERNGEPTQLAAAIRPGSTVVDGKGRLWAIDDRSGDVVRLPATGPLTRTTATRTGHLTIADGQPVLVDPERGAAELLSPETGAVTRSAPTTLRADEVVDISGSPTMSRVLIASSTRGELIVCSLAGGSCADPVRVGSPGADLGAPIEAGDHAVVPDYSTGQATIVDLATQRVVSVGRLFDRPVRFELIARDGIVFFNDPGGSTAGVLDLTGNVRTITKYAEGPSASDTPPKPDPQRQSDQATKVGHQKQKPGLALPGKTVRTPQADPAPQPVASIVVSPGRRGAAGDEFELTMLLRPAGTATTRWSFGDGTEATGTTVRHSWREPGTFTVRAIATFGTGTTAPAEAVITVDPAQTPPEITRLDIGRAKPVVGQSVHFSAETTAKPDRWEWTVARSGESTPEFTARTAEFDHGFPAAGTYTVTLTITKGSKTARSSRDLTVVRGAVEGWSDKAGDWGWEPVEIPAEASSGVIAIEAGQFHVLALKSDGSVVTWGAVWGWEMTVPAEATSGVVAISASAHNSVALKADGSVVAWGSDATGLNDVPASAKQDVVAIAAGEQHALALKKDGSVVQWGNNFGRQITVPREALSGVLSIAAGPGHSMAARDDGTLVIWSQSENLPCWFEGMPVRNAAAVAAGNQSCQVLTTGGSVISRSWATGNGPFPVPPEALSDVVTVTSGYNHNFAVKADGTAIGWGNDDFSQATVPAKYGNRVMALSPGKDFSIILLE